jgi:hypothetical protein
VLVAELADAEASLLGQFLDELVAINDVLDGDDPLVQRLFPAGYRGDAEAAADFRELTQLSLQRERRDRYVSCRGDLPGGGGRLAFTDESAHRWLLVVNDMRLAVGTRLGVTAEPADPDPGDPEYPAYLAYHWLTALQDGLLTQIAG